MLKVNDSGVSQVLASVSELLCELMEHVLEHNVVDVLAEEVEQEPVAHAGLVHHNLYALGLDSSVAELEQVDPQRAGQAQRHPANSEILGIMGFYVCLHFQQRASITLSISQTQTSPRKPLTFNLFIWV